MGETMTDDYRRELLVTYLKTVISNLAHPVGMGIAPTPHTLNRMAADCFKIATANPEPRT